MRLAQAPRVYLLGAILLVALTICSYNFADRGGPFFMASLVLGDIVYLLAVREFFIRPAFPRRVVVVGLVLAAVWHVEFLRVPTGAEEDVYRYVWDGRLQRLGYNPYLVVPSDPAAAALHTTETRKLNNPSLPSPYPPGAQLFFRTVTAIRESAFALRIAFVVCDFAIVLVLLDILRRTRQGIHLVLVYAWNPLLAIEVAGTGHIDILGVLLLLVSLAALIRRWRATASVAFGLAIAVKFLPIVLLPCYWKRVRIRDAVLAVAVVAVLYLPFLDHGRPPTGSLGAYVQGFRFNGPLFAALAHVWSPQVAAVLALLAGLIVAAGLQRAMPALVPHTFAWPMAATLLFAPVIFPWYLLWLVPFLTSAPALLLILWTVSIIPTYIMWHFRALGLPWGALPAWVMLVEYGVLAIAALVIAWRRISRPAALHGAAAKAP